MGMMNKLCALELGLDEKVKEGNKGLNPLLNFLNIKHHEKHLETMI
jgi:hypothetical protein